jgi:ribosomal protein S21
MCQVRKNPDETIDSLLYRFNKKVYNERLLETSKLKDYFENKRDKRKRKLRTLTKAKSIERKRAILQQKLMEDNSLDIEMPSY